MPKKKKNKLILLYTLNLNCLVDVHGIIIRLYILPSQHPIITSFPENLAYLFLKLFLPVQNRGKEIYCELVPQGTG